MWSVMYIEQRRQETYPQKIKHIEKSKLAMLPPVSARSTPAMIICANVDVNMRKFQMKRNIKPDRSVIESVASVLRYKPMG